MSSEDTEYREGSHSDFICYLFGNEPKPRNTIVLESPPNDPSKNPGLHIFEQLLMIFVDGLKYFHGHDVDPGQEGREGTVDVNSLTRKDIIQVQEYFRSMNYDAIIETFETVQEYKFRFPNYFKDQEKITEECVLHDFYYEIYGDNNKVFRISFDYF